MGFFRKIETEKDSTIPEEEIGERVDLGGVLAPRKLEYVEQRAIIAELRGSEQAEAVNRGLRNPEWRKEDAGTKLLELREDIEKIRREILRDLAAGVKVNPDAPFGRFMARVDAWRKEYGSDFAQSEVDQLVNEIARIRKEYAEQTRRDEWGGDNSALESE
jgi:hypothetical protein